MNENNGGDPRAEGAAAIAQIVEPARPRQDADYTHTTADGGIERIRHAWGAADSADRQALGQLGARFRVARADPAYAAQLRRRARRRAVQYNRAWRRFAPDEVRSWGIDRAEVAARGNRYGLDPEQLAAEVTWLLGQGWDDVEIVTVLGFAAHHLLAAEDAAA